MRRKALLVLGFGLALGVACAQAPGRGQMGGAGAQRQGGGQAGAQGRAGAQAGQTVVAAGQQAVPVDPKKLCKIEGRTVNARTGELVPRVTLNLVAAGPGASGRSARSGADGSFLIEGVPPGSYRLMAERVGFLREGYGARTPGGAGAPLNLTESQHLKDLEFRLTPQGVILGQVFDDQGDPLPRASVTAYPVGGGGAAVAGAPGGGRGMAAGMAAGTAGSSSQANDIGEYRIAGLSPGRYYVIATSQGGMPGRGMGGRGAAPGQANEDGLSPMPTYYPSSLDVAAAVPVEIAAGQDAAGINITIREGQMFRITGRLMAAAPLESNSVVLSLMPRAGAPGGRGGASAGVKPDGAFEIARVRPGSYFLLAQRMGRGGAGIAAKTLVDVAASDITGLVVPLAEPVAIAGNVKLEGDQAATTQLRPVLSLISADGLPVGTPAGRATDAGAFKLDAVFPDRYYLNVSGVPEGAYIKSIRLGGQEVIEKGIDLSNSHGTAALDVLLSPKAASLDGTVTIDGKPGTGTYVAVLPDPVRPEQPFRNKFATADQDGRFTITGLAPGSYSVYAFPEPMPQLSRDPGLVKPYERHATKVRLNESSTERVELKAIDAPGAR